MSSHHDISEPRPDLRELGRTVVRGGLSLGARHLVALVVSIAAGIVLARTLDPATFGLYAIVAFVTRFFAHFSNVGLGAALIRSPRIDDDDLATAFVLQQALVGTAVVLLSATAGLWADLYGITGAAPMIRTLAFGLWIGSWGTIPSLVLERAMRFETIAVADLASTFTYHALAVALALGGLGVWSFLLAALARSTVHAAALNLASPWRPRLAFRRDRARELLSFGLPFQMNKIVTLFKDNITPTLVAVAAGSAAVGYLNWAQSVAYLPLTVMPILQRVTFPAYSRIQDDPAALRRALETSFRLLALGLYPVAFLLMALAPEIVRFVYTEKWLPALPAFYLFSIATLWAIVSTPSISALHAVGRANVVLRLTVVWTIAGWGLSVPLVLVLGWTGFAVAMAIVSQMSILSVWEIRRLTPVRILPQIALPFACAAATGAAVRLGAAPLVEGLGSLALAGFGGVVLYLALLAAFGGRRLLGELRPLLTTLPVVGGAPQPAGTGPTPGGGGRV